MINVEFKLYGRDFNHVHALLAKGFTWVSHAAKIKVGNQVLELWADDGVIYGISNLSHNVDYFYFRRELTENYLFKDTFSRKMSDDELRRLLGYEDKAMFESQMRKVKKFTEYVLFVFQDKDKEPINLYKKNYEETVI